MTSWHSENNNLVQEQINLEYKASLTYHYLFYLLNCSEYALDNIANYFNSQSLEEREHANIFIKYLNKRGGIICSLSPKEYHPIDIEKSSIYSLLNSVFKIALNLEIEIYDHLMKLHKSGTETNDPQFCDFIESNFLEEQIESIDQFKRYLTQINQCGDNNYAIWDFNNNFEKM